GFGTLDELFEMVTWNQLSIHDKLIFIINSNGFYDHLLVHIKTMQEEGFLYEEAIKRLIVLKEPSALIPYLS
ncbi:MAG: LOG family protein, partial [Chitinophagaceae bacterium]